MEKFYLTDFYLFLVFLITVVNCTADIETGVQDPSHLLDFIVNKSDERLRPKFGGPPIEVNVTVIVYNLGPITISDMEFTTHIYLRQEWIDPRLRFANNTEIYLTAGMVERIWVPDTYFGNEKNAKYHDVTSRNSLLRINSNGHVFFSTRLTVTVGCPMDVTSFPFDSHVCPLTLQSYAYGSADVQYKWIRENPVRIFCTDLPQFTLVGFSHHNSTVEYDFNNYTQLVTEFFVVRKISYYIIHTYVPSIMLVVLSWISFWLPKNATPARITLGVTTVLSMTAVMGDSGLIAKLSYVKAIDIFVVVCYVYVFAALLEYAVVNFIEVQEAKPFQKKIQKEGRSMKNIYTETACDKFSSHPFSKNNFEVTSYSSFWKDKPEVHNQKGALCPDSTKIKRKSKIKRHDIDYYARIVFPVTFVLFQMWYWVHYTILEKVIVNVTLADKNMTEVSY